MLSLLHKKYFDRQNRYSPLTNAAILDLARSISTDERLNNILIKRGLHGDFSQDEDDLISTLIIANVESRGWTSPDPKSLCISLALSRLFSNNRLSIGDHEKAMEYIEDRSLSGVITVKPSTHKAIRISELIPILERLDQNSELKAPFEDCRSSGKAPVFESDDRRLMHEVRILKFLSNEWDKYALWSRGTQAIHRIVFLIYLYAEEKINSLSGPDALAHLKRFSKPNAILKLVDDIDPGDEDVPNPRRGD